MRTDRLGVAALAAVLATGGCSGTIDQTIDKVLPKREAEYKSSRSLPPLEVPPDLSSGAIDDSLQVPQGSTTYSEYQSGSAQRVSARESAVLPELSQVRVERSGDERWLVVDAAPAEVWPKLRSFWLEQGFLIEMADPGIGIMETDWAEQRHQFDSGFIKGLISKVSSALYGAATRDKFRTRLERGARPGITEVYVSHRGAEEVSTGKVSRSVDATGGDETKVWQPRPADPELEAEMLNRMMIYLGVQEERANQLIAQTRDERERARFVRADAGERALALDESFSRAWRRTGLALDRVGFTVADRDRSRGLYYVRYVDPDADIGNDKGGFFSKLKFWGSDEPEREDEYLISLVGGREGQDTTQVVVLDKRGEPATNETADRILTLLHEQLR